MKLIVGLGNPGEEYAETRHNLGFMAVDQLSRWTAGEVFTLSSKAKAEVAETVLGHEKCILVKPLTFMNLSGDAVGKLARFYKLEPTDVWVVHDELDLPYGRLRIRIGGGSAGHNGLKSIMDALGPDFVRFRSGVANSQLKNPLPADRFVLSAFNDEERLLLSRVVEGTARAVREAAIAGLAPVDLDLIETEA